MFFTYKNNCILISEDEILNQKCLSIDKEYTIKECATFFLQIHSLDETFYRYFTNSNNGKECINTENGRVMKLENFCIENYLYSNCKFNMSRIFGDDNECYTFKKKMIITYLCSGQYNYLFVHIFKYGNIYFIR